MSIIAVYFAWQANGLITQQNELIQLERKASYLPDIHIEPVTLSLVIPAKDETNVSLVYSGNAMGKKDSDYLPGASLPIKLLNIGKGPAKELKVTWNYQLDTIISALDKRPGFSLERNQAGEISQVGYDGHFDFLRPRSSNVSYLIPYSGKNDKGETYLPPEYTALFALHSYYALAYDKKDIPQASGAFPPLQATISYRDMENNEAQVTYEMRLAEELIYHNTGLDGHRKYWVKSIKLEPTRI